MKSKIYIYNPSTKSGGTNNLMFNLAVLLNTKENYEVVYLDYENSPFMDIISGNNIQINHVIVRDEERLMINDGIFISILLAVKSFNNNVFLSDNTRMLFWSTHPDDGLKILSSFNIWLRLPLRYRWIISTLIHPFLKTKIRSFFKQGIKKNGIFFMDNENVKSNRAFYNLNEKATILPIFTSYPKDVEKKTNEVLNLKTLKIIVLGRFTSFKVNSLFGLIEQILDYKRSNNLIIEVDFIGNGPLLDKTKEWIANKGLKNCNYYGHVNLPDLDKIIVNYDLLIGMGTSLLESAKLKIPSLAIYASNDKLTKDNVKLRWLYELKPYEVGGFVSAKDKEIDGKMFSNIVEELEENKKDIGKKCYNHWQKFHSPSSTFEKIENIIESNSFFFKEQKHLLKEDYTSKMINSFKRALQK